MGEENDITDYILFRSTDGENFEELTGGLYSLNYWDRDVEKETKYRYRVQVRDRAGNISEASQIVEAILPEDTLPTEIRSFAPENGSVIGQSNSEFKVLVSDNWKLSSVVVKYHMEGEEEEHILLEEAAIQDYYMLLSAEMPVSELKDGDKIYLSVAVTDLQGLETRVDNISYTIDRTPPQIDSLAASSESDKLVVSWKGNREQDLAGYRVYRKTAAGQYSMIAQRSASESGCCILPV